MSLMEIFSSIGLQGVFWGSLLSNLIPYSAMPYLALIAAYSASVTTERLIVALVGGAGATLGKLILFSLIKLAGKKIKEKRRENIEYLNQLISGKSSFLTIFLFAALPLPDDVIYIPLGLAGFSILKFLFPLLLGKTFLVGFVAFLGSRARLLMEYSIESGLLPLGILVMVLFTIELILIVFFVDWLKIFTEYTTKGLKSALRALLTETMLVISLKHPELKNWYNRWRKPS